MEIQYHGIENFVMVSKNDIAVLLNFGILQSPNMRDMLTVPFFTSFTHLGQELILWRGEYLTLYSPVNR